MKKIKVKVPKSIYKMNEGNVATYKVDLTPKQTKKCREKIGLTVHGIDILFNYKGKKAKVVRMYRNGKRIHRKSLFKAHITKKG